MPTLPNSVHATLCPEVYEQMFRRRGASSVERLVEWEERFEARDQLKGVFPQIWGGIEPNCYVTCMVLKDTDNGRRSSILFPSINRH
ncbi:hypothetical protein TNCV_1953091 [Trichonephila clavipes]|nr:hypothetical protein TNCV_1953091 [Trichonephila clavipes]